MPQGVVFDLDGVLIDSEKTVNTYTLESVIIQIVGRLPSKETMYQARLRMAQASEEQSIRIFCEALGLGINPETFTREYLEMKVLRFPFTGFTLGAKELVQRLSRKAVPMGIATNTPHTSFVRKTEHLQEAFQHIPHVCTLDDVKHGKPAPDVYLMAAERIGIAPEDCLVFEDSPKGIEAAKAAGMEVIAITELFETDDLPDADAYIPDLRQFNPVSWGLYS